MLDPNDWKPLRLVWRDFVTANPELGYSASDHSYGRFARAMYPQMHAAGAMTRIRGRYFAHRGRFASAAFSLLAEHEIGEV